jgi:DNA modification methylase
MQAARCNGLIADVWREGKSFFSVGAIPRGARDRGVYCVSHYLFYGDAEAGLSPLGYGREDERAQVIIDWFLRCYTGHLTPRREESYIAHIRRACNWRNKNSEPRSERLVDRLAATQSTPDRFTHANLKRQNQARCRILATYHRLIKENDGEVPSIRAVAKAAGAHRNTVRAALGGVGQANNPNPDLAAIRDQESENQELRAKKEKARVYDAFCAKQAERAARLHDFRKGKAISFQNSKPREGMAFMAKSAVASKKKPTKKPVKTAKAEKNQIAVIKPEPQPEPTLAQKLSNLRLQITYRSPDELVGFSGNAKQHSPEQIDLIASSIRDYGFVEPVLVDGSRGIIGGHGRIMAAQKLGLEVVPTIEISHLTDIEKRALIILLNKSAEYKTSWDNAKLALELRDLKDHDFDLPSLGFELPEIDEIFGVINQLPIGSTGDPNEVPAPPKTAITKPGDVWLLGQHRLVCGDSTNPTDMTLLMRGEKADVLFTDPPYGVNYEGGHFHSGDVKIKRKREKLQADDNADIYAEFLPIVLPHVDGPCYVWYASTRSYEVYKALRDCEAEISACLIWHKTNATYAAMNAQYKNRHEPLVYFKPHGSTLRWCGASDESTLWEVARDGVNEYHPTQKPVELAERALGNHEAVTVLDCFAGSGSTLIAAERTNKRAFLMELNPVYCDVIIKRWQQYTDSEAQLDGGNTYNELAEAAKAFG